MKPDPRISKLLSAMKRDATLAPVADAYDPAATKGRKFGANALKVNGKLFALFTQGTLVVKLPKERVTELVDEELGVPFDPGHGRRMKEWLTVTGARASWIALVRESHAFVAADGGKKAQKTGKSAARRK